MPMVTVVIPTYNRKSLVCEALDSVLSQTYTDFEVIIVDDGSTDNTACMLSEYDDPRLYLIRQENQGQGPARNAGILAAKGNYIAFLDSDDLWIPVKLKAQVAFFDKYEKLEWVYSDAYAFDGETKEKLYIFSQKGRQYEGYIAHQLFMNDFIATSTVMVKRHVFEEIGLFKHITKAQDWEMWLRIAARHHIRKVPHALTEYRIHKNMITQTQEPLFKFQCHTSVLEHAVVFAPEIYGSLYQRAMASQCINTGGSLLVRSSVREARRMFINAIRHSPRVMKAYLLWAATLLDNRILGKLIKIYNMRRGM